MPAPVDVEGALAYVRGHGKPRDRAFLNVLLREELSDADLAAITEMQNPDGGFRAPEVTGTASVVGQTAAAVIHLCALGAEEFGMTQAAADFLLHRQRPDGRWGEDGLLAAANPPRYFQPGSTDVEAWETASACVGLLALGLPLDHRPATGWLAHRPCLKGERPAFSFEPPLIYSLFHRLESAGTHLIDAARRATAAIDVRAVDAWELYYGIEAMRLVGVPATDGLVVQFADGLEARQAPDRGFADGGASDALTTVHALAALDLAGRIHLEKRPSRAEEEPDLADAARAL